MGPLTDESEPASVDGFRRADWLCLVAECRLSERALIPRGHARISARASLPFDGANEWRVSRFSQRPYKAARVRRTRYRLQSPMADDHTGESERRVGAQDMRSLALAWRDSHIFRVTCVGYQ